MENTFFKDKNGRPFMPIGLQAHNSATGSHLIKRALRAVELYGGNCLEAPVYWNRIEPVKDQYEMDLVKGLIDETRGAGLHLIILWFGTSKNGHPNYVPEYIKLEPARYLLAKGPDGAPVASLSPHCMETLERDRKAFVKLMEFLKEYDGEEGTVLAVQIENEMGLANTDRDYGETAQADYAAPVPEALRGVTLADSGLEQVDAQTASPWKAQFGRHSHEAFSAWYHARYINAIAEAGKAVYDLPMVTNVMVGENGYEEAGKCYNAGAAVSRVLDIWKAGAPSLDLLCPDIYNQNRNEYNRICRSYARPDNALFIPESPMQGEANPMNALLAVADHDAIGVCCFGAESAVDDNGNLLESCRSMALTMRTLAGMTPLLMKYRGTGRVHAIAEEEFETSRYLKLDDYHVTAYFSHSHLMNYGHTQDWKSEEGKKKLQVRGRAILVQAEDHEFYLGGAGVAIELIRRPHPGDEASYSHLSSRQSSQLNFLSVEEGHFEDGQWVTDFVRNGDETNFAQYVLEGQIIRIRMNPNVGMEV